MKTETQRENKHSPAPTDGQTDNDDDRRPLGGGTAATKSAADQEAAR